MEISFDEIKNELQGSSGLIKLIREKHLPNTSEMATIAQSEYENQINDFSNIDLALDTLLKLEYTSFKEKQKQVVDNFIEFADNDAVKNKFPIVRKIIDDYKIAIADQGEPTKLLSGIINITVALADSNRQARVARAGSSLANHISYLLNKHGFVPKKDFQKDFLLKSGSKLDFFFPNLEVFNEDPKNCVAVACQTTSNDRFRLTFAQMPHFTRNRACTAIGSTNFGKKLGPASLTINKLEEAKENGVKFVILANALDERLKKSKAVISYQEWFEELGNLKKAWA